jgi:hypothetical protein
MAIESIDSYKFVPRDPSSKPAPAPPIAERDASGHAVAVGKRSAGGERQ